MANSQLIGMVGRMGGLAASAGGASGGLGSITAALIPAALQTGLGIGQLIKSSQIKPRRPIKSISEAYNNARSAAVFGAIDRNPLETTLAIDAARVANANAVNQLGNSQNGASVIPALASVQNQATNQALVEQSRQADTNRARLVQNENAYGRLQDEVFDYNKIQPYEEQAAAKRALVENGIKNIFGGATDATNIGLRQNDLGKLQKALKGAATNGEVARILEAAGIETGVTNPELEVNTGKGVTPPLFDRVPIFNDQGAADLYVRNRRMGGNTQRAQSNIIGTAQNEGLDRLTYRRNQGYGL